MRISIDDRRAAYCDIFPTPGDINISVINPGVAIFWHRHQHQDDYMFVPQGSLKIGICNGPNMLYEDAVGSRIRHYPPNYIEERMHQWKTKYRPMMVESTNINSPYRDMFPENEFRCEFKILTDRNPEVVKIPRGLWHGSYNYTNEPAILVYYITKKWDGSDEDRATVEEMNWEYRTIVK